MELILKGLQSLPKLTELEIDSLSKDELQLLAQKLPRLSFPNNNLMGNEEFIKPVTFSPYSINEPGSAVNPENNITIDPLETQLRCLEFLFQEHEEGYMVDSDVIKRKLAGMVELFDQNGSVGRLEGLEIKAELEINWFVLETLADYLRKYNDRRAALILEASVGRSRVLTDFFFGKFLKMEKLQNKIRNLEEENQRLIFEKNEVQIKLQNVQQENVVREKVEPIKTRGLNVQNSGKKEGRILSKQKLKLEEGNSKNGGKVEIADQMTKDVFLETMKSQENNRLFSILQLKTIIKQLTHSKIKKDNNFLLAELPFVTMKEHFFNFAQKKFGIKKLVREFASTFFSSLKKHEQFSSEIFVFLKALENKISEDFHKVLEIVKLTLRKVLGELRPDKFKTINASQIEMQVDYQDVIEVLCLLYSDTEVIQITNSMKPFLEPKINKNSNLRFKNQQNEIVQNCIDYRNFEFCVCQFICEAQVKLLESISIVFSDFDVEKEGKLSEEQFQVFVEKLNRFKGVQLDVDDLMLKLDPSGTGVFTYSSIVSLLSMYCVMVNEQQKSIFEIVNEEISEKKE